MGKIKMFFLLKISFSALNSIMSPLSLAEGECNINQLTFRYYVNYNCLIMNRNCHQFCGFHPAITLRGGSSNLSRGPPLTNLSQLHSLSPRLLCRYLLTRLSHGPCVTGSKVTADDVLLYNARVATSSSDAEGALSERL